MKPVKEYLRSVHSILCTIYLDDILIISESDTHSNEDLDITLKLLTSLGFTVNYEKSNLEPSQSCQFLGFILNSRKMTIELPKEKRKKKQK